MDLGDEEYMGEAIKLARGGLGKCSPNPAVGALLVKNGKIIGRGFHEKAGLPHAEINAIADAKSRGEELSGATMYVSLEPCVHHGRTPPCVDAIIREGISRVVVARADPNPKVNGRGLAKLEAAGIRTRLGIMEEESRRMNEMYEKFITTREPFVVAKAALSADGKMSAYDGSSKWISGEEARLAAHKLRSQVDAVIVGVNTVLRDDPLLTARINGAKNPIRIVLDPSLKTPLSAKLLGREAETIIITSEEASLKKADALRRMGVDVRVESMRGGMIDLKRLMRQLGREEITSVMVEGGGETIGRAFDAGIVDKLMFFISPKILGGKGTAIRGKGFRLDEALQLERVEMKRIGEDFLLSGYPRKREPATYKPPRKGGRK